MFARAMHSPDHPIVAQVVPIRRCNLACTYCNEFDAISQPVPLPEMLRRIDLLAALGTTIITVSGGEPMLHPKLDEIIRHIRRRGALATLITNGYLLTPERVQRLNRAGLDYLQISIDNVVPDETSKKSLEVLDRKLELLAADADFAVTVNSVLGSPVRNPTDALTIAGGRFLYICEDGLVHYCSQQRGRPGIPLEQYTHDHLKREAARRTAHNPAYQPPLMLKVLTWAFLDGRNRRVLSKLALHVLGARS
jgi:hypothetical protein